MLLMIVFGVIGYIAGILLRFTVFSARDGAGWGVSLGLAFGTCIVAIPVLTAYAQTQLGATGSPTWVGGASFFLAGGLFWGMRRRVQE